MDIARLLPLAGRFLLKMPPVTTQREMRTLWLGGAANTGAVEDKVAVQAGELVFFRERIRPTL